MQSRREYRKLLITVKKWDEVDILATSGGEVSFNWDDSDQLQDGTGNLFGGFLS